MMKKEKKDLLVASSMLLVGVIVWGLLVVMVNEVKW